MAAASAARRQRQPTSITAKEQTLETMLQDFQCEACGQYKIRLTERESWYTCANCGYGFGIEPHPKKHMRRATDVAGGGSISH